MIKSIFLAVLLSTTSAFAVIGGIVAKPGEFAASVFVQEAHCSAVMIREDLLLLAGHCVNARAEETKLQVGFQLHIVSTAFESGRPKIYKASIVNLESHPLWIKALKKTNDPNIAMMDDDQTLDLAVMQLDAKLPMAAAKLPRRAKIFADYENITFLVTGFGCDVDQGLPIESLKYFSVPLMSAVDGKWRYRFSTNETQTTKICGGDSGSALYDERDPQTVLGINSGAASSLGIAARIDKVAAQVWLRQYLQTPVAKLIAPEVDLEKEKEEKRITEQLKSVGLRKNPSL